MAARPYSERSGEQSRAKAWPLGWGMAVSVAAAGSRLHSEVSCTPLRVDLRAECLRVCRRPVLSGCERFHLPVTLLQ